MNWEDRLLELRAGFDRSFTEPPRPVEDDQEDLIALRCGGVSLAVRLKEMSALVAGKRITPLPGSLPEMLGLAGFRGSVVPVYALDRLLDLPAEPAGWLLLTAASPRVGLAFERFEGHLRVPRAEIVPDATRPHLQAVVRGRSVLAVDSLLNDLKRRAR